MDLNDKKSENKFNPTDLQQAGDSLDNNPNLDKDLIDKNLNDENLRTNNSSLDKSAPTSKTNEKEDEFDSEEWLDLLDNKDILKKVLFSEEKDLKNPSLPRANRGSKAWINVETKIYSTQQLIPTECYQNLEVIVGDYDVIHGIDLILPMMHLHEKSRVVINPRFGYGTKGKLPDVEPDCRLDCTVEILKIQDDLDEYTLEEKILMAEKKKIRGNFWFSREEYQTAISCYRKCVELFENINEEELDEKAIRLLINTYNNLSLAQIKIESFNQALESVNKALNHDPKNIKSLYRKATILEKKNDLEEAVELLKDAIEIEPNNSDVANLLIKLRKIRLIELENEKKLYQKMISNDKKNTIQNDKMIETNPSSNASSSVKSENLIGKKFHYTIFLSSAFITILLAFLINNYMINYS